MDIISSVVAVILAGEANPPPDFNIIRPLHYFFFVFNSWTLSALLLVWIVAKTVECFAARSRHFFSKKTDKSVQKYCPNTYLEIDKELDRLMQEKASAWWLRWGNHNDTNETEYHEIIEYPNGEKVIIKGIKLRKQKPRFLQQQMHGSKCRRINLQDYYKHYHRARRVTGLTKTKDDLQCTFSLTNYFRRSQSQTTSKTKNRLKSKKLRDKIQKQGQKENIKVEQSFEEVLADLKRQTSVPTQGGSYVTCNYCERSFHYPVYNLKVQ
mmetsp:Transcript_4232/g.4650  ORF Transcript_4232/g.4650 Transcript_4232/m.4650 type:complete len:267 (-) Transcript_4232:136-936(-)